MNKKLQKPELIILSDLQGLEGNQWINLYLKELKNEFKIFLYDSCKLAEINRLIVDKEHRHREFIKGGIVKAVSNLMGEKHHNSFIMGFSIGGTIAWKATQSGMPNKALYAISATRLRYEHSRPKTHIQLYYGGSDPFKPSAKWLDTFALTPQIIEGNHEFYRHENAKKQIVSDVLEEKAALS